MGDEPGWVDQLCGIAAEWREGTLSIRERFERAAPDLDDPAILDYLRRRLGRDSDLVDAWQSYSDDKRSSPSPYLDGLEVGFYDAGRGDVSRHDHPVDACADFIHREARWVLARQH